MQLKLKLAAVAVLLSSVALSSAARAAGPAFTAAPSARPVSGGFEITFAASEPTDVEVAVLDKTGRVVRHLAAGLLGDNPPAPLAKGLAQKLTWDGVDDAGRKSDGGPFKVRVRLGSTPRKGAIAGRADNSLGGLVGLACSPAGEIYVICSESYRGRSEIRVLDRDGKYLRTILPYSADTPAARTESVGHLMVDGERLPVVFNGLGHTLSPLVNGMRNQDMAFHPKGYMLFASGIGTMAEHRPPRHLLAVDPKGGAPEGVPFIGPQLRVGADRSIGGGNGEGYTDWFDHLAVSPDGQWVYLTTFTDSRFFKVSHGVWRVKWSDPAPTQLFVGADEPGDDDTHMNTPQGLALDAAGRLYVCDSGNNRVMIFSPEGKLLAKTPVDAPEQIALDPKSGQFFVVSRTGQHRKRVGRSTVLSKFAAFTGQGVPAKLASLDNICILNMALDSSGEKPRLWVYAYSDLSKSYYAPKFLLPVIDRDGKLELGDAAATDAGLWYPMFVAGDAARNRAYVYDREVKQLDLADGSIRSFAKGTDVTTDVHGNVYILDGYGTNSLSRYSPDGKPLAFGEGGNKIKTNLYRGYGPNLGLQGLAVRPNGDIYVMGSSNYGAAGAYGGRVCVFAPDGTMKTKNIIDGMGYGDSGIGVDAAGNIYVGVNLKPADHPLPDYFAGQVPADTWVFYKDADQRPAPWRYTYLNAYLWDLGGVMKFGPDGGGFYGQHPWNLKDKKYGQPTEFDQLDKAPANAAVYKSAYLGWTVKVAGSQWYHQGMGIIPSSGDGLKPDPGCVCYNSHLAADPYGRVFVPNVFRFSVEMLDSAGNPIARIGRYGNADDSKSRLAFAWPAFVAAQGGKVFVSDTVNRQVVVVDFDYAAERTCEVN